MAKFKEELNWALLNMPRTIKKVNALPNLEGKKIACSMHLDLKMIPFVENIIKKGAKVFLTTCNPTTVQNEVVEYLVSKGAEAYAWRDMSFEEWEKSLVKALEWEPDYLCEMGASLTTLIHSGKIEYKNKIKGSLEATGSGINNLATIKPYYPIFNWDDVPVKEGLHNRHMVGLTACHTFFSTTRLTMHEKVVLVVGYGLVGQGVVDAAKAYGGEIIVAEIEPARALQAKYSGLRVLNIDSAILEADIIVTATGAKNVISADHMKKMKSGVFLMNVGHVAEEIDMQFLKKNYEHSLPMPFVDSYEINKGENKKQIFVLANGSMVNLTAGFGDSLNAFDVSLAVMTSGIGYMVSEGYKKEPNLYLIPPKVWKEAL